MHLLANKIPRLALYGNVLNGFLVLTETKKTSGYLVLSDMHLLADKNPRLTLYGNVLYGFLVLSETKKPRVIWYYSICTFWLTKNLRQGFMVTT